MVPAALLGVCGGLADPLGVSGEVQAADGVVHVVVDKPRDPREYAKPAAMHSRDFD